MSFRDCSASAVGNDRMGMSQRVDREPADEIEVLLAIGVPHTGAFATLDDDRLAPVVLEQVALLVGDPVSHLGLQW